MKEAIMENQTNSLEIENEKLKSTVNALLAAQNMAHIGSFEYDILSRTQTLTEEALRILGISAEDASRASEIILQRIHPDDREIAFKIGRKAAAERRNVDFDCRMVTDNGQDQIVRIQITPLFDDNGTCVRTVGTVEDITERKSVEHDLFREKQFTEAVFESIPGYLYVYDETGHLIRWNKNHEAMTGYSDEELSKMTINNWFEGEDVKKVGIAVNEVLTKGYGEVEANLLCKDGKKILIRSTGVLMTLDGNKYFTGVGIDITEQRKAEAELLESKEMVEGCASRFLSLFDHMSSGAVIYKVLNTGSRGEDFIVVDFNQVGLLIEGKERSEVQGKNLLELRPNIASSGLLPVFQKVWNTGRAATFTAKVYTDEIQYHWYENHIFKLPSGELVSIYDDVTERHVLNEKLKESEIKHRRLFETMAQGVVYQTSDGSIISANPSAERILGLPFENMAGKTLMDPVWRTIKEDGSTLIGSAHPSIIALRTGKPYGPVVLGMSQPMKSEYIWLSVTSIPLFQKGETAPYQVYTTMQDITAERNASQDYRTLFRQMVDGFAVHEIICDDQGQPVNYRFLSVNPAFEKMTGLSSDDIINKTVLDIMPNTESYWIDIYGKVAQTGVSVEFENYSESLKKYFHVTAYQTKPNQFAVTFVDITNRIQAETIMKEALARLRSLLDYSPSPIFIIDKNGTYVEVSAAVADIIGLPEEEIRGKTVHELFPPQKAAEIMKVIRILQKKRQPIEVTDIMVFSGKERTYSNIFFPIESPAGKSDLFGCIKIDITDRKRAEDALKDSEKKYSSYIENAPDGVFITDERGRYIEANRAASAITGYSTDELLHMSFEEILTDGFRIKEKSLYVDMMNEGSATGEFIFRYKSGEKRWLSVDTVMLKDTRFLFFARDITDIKASEESLVHLSYHDQLTGVYNRRFFEKELLRLDNEQNLPLSIVMADINGLKLVNDSFGHPVGDALLNRAAELIKKTCRNSDIIARLGGDEFVVILPRTNAIETTEIVNRIQELAAGEKIANIAMSVSFGHDTKKNGEERIADILAGAENNMYRNKLFERTSMRSKTIDVIMNALFEKSSREMMHSKRVSKICGEIAGQMNFDKDSVNQMRIAGLVHDIGKIGIDEAILNKTESLTDSEWKEMKKHPETGWRILSATNEFSELARYILEHQEKWDGKGYPKGLKGKETSAQARIIAIADSYDAMTSSRSYRKALSEEQAIEEIRKCAGTQFDPDIARIFIEKVMNKEWHCS